MTALVIEVSDPPRQLKSGRRAVDVWVTDGSTNLGVAGSRTEELVKVKVTVFYSEVDGAVPQYIDDLLANQNLARPFRFSNLTASRDQEASAEACAIQTAKGWYGITPAEGEKAKKLMESKDAIRNKLSKQGQCASFIQTHLRNVVRIT